MGRVPKYSRAQVISTIEGVVQDSISKDIFNVLERAFWTHLGEHIKCSPSKKITNDENKEKDVRSYIKTFHKTFDTPKARVESEHHVLWHILDRFLFFLWL